MARKKKVKKRKKAKKLGFRSGFVIGFVGFVGIILALNFVYQIYRKPAEAINFVRWTEAKTLSQTWKSYKSHFIKYSTNNISPQFLAALAQVESSGDPLATPQWDIQLNRSYKNWFAPLSSSVGLYQFTKGTFKRAKNYCIYKNRSVTKGKWYQLNRCGLNWLYSRLWPSHSIEVTSGYLDHRVKQLIGKRRVSKRTKSRLAAVIHLCGEGRAKRFIKRGFRLRAGERCGSHSLKRYISKIESYQRHLRTKRI